jgi:hypothetical protein
LKCKEDCLNSESWNIYFFYNLNRNYNFFDSKCWSGRGNKKICIDKRNQQLKFIFWDVIIVIFKYKYLQIVSFNLAICNYSKTCVQRPPLLTSGRCSEVGLCYKGLDWGSTMMVAVARWSLFGGGH